MRSFIPDDGEAYDAARPVGLSHGQELAFRPDEPDEVSIRGGRKILSHELVETRRVTVSQPLRDLRSDSHER